MNTKFLSLLYYKNIWHTLAHYLYFKTVILLKEILSSQQSVPLGMFLGGMLSQKVLKWLKYVV